jgi:hypothetical protein
MLGFQGVATAQHDCGRHRPSRRASAAPSEGSISFIERTPTTPASYRCSRGQRLPALLRNDVFGVPIGPAHRIVLAGPLLVLAVRGRSAAERACELG